MHDYSRAFGDTIRNARTRLGYTQKQIADKINVDERSIASIEKYQANTTMDILHPLIRTLRVDPNEIFYPELGADSPVRKHLNFLIAGCTEEEAATLISVIDSVLNALRSKDANLIGQK